jgi:hypothetical protein
LEDLSKAIEQDGLEFDSLPSLNTKEDFNQINDFFACTMRDINHDNILNENGFDLLDSFDSNSQLMSLPLDTFPTDASAYLNLDDSNSVDTNVLYSVDPPVVTSSAYPVLSDIPTTTSTLYNSNDFPSPPEEANNWTANDLFIYDVPEVTNPTTSSTSTATTTPTLPSQTFSASQYYDYEYIDVAPSLTPCKKLAKAQQNAPTSSTEEFFEVTMLKDNVSVKKESQEEDTSFEILKDKKTNTQSFVDTTKIIPQAAQKKQVEIVETVKVKQETDDIMDLLSKNLFDINLNEDKKTKPDKSDKSDNALRAKHAALIATLSKKFNQLSKKLNEQVKEKDNVKVKIEV